MSVTNYTPNQCRYYIGKLENVVYLVSEEALKDIKIDNGSAYVASVNESPLSIKCYNLKLNEDESLDERYKFTHTVTFSVKGYMNKESFNDKYYVILKDVEGTYWLVNPLFPSKVTYTYTLGDMQNHTDFTLATASNHPVLRLNEFTVTDSNECESYWFDGVDELRLNEKKYSAHIESHIKYTNPGGFKDVHFNEKTCVITETFDGEKVSHQIDFNILLSQYKNDWHYSLLEFKDNIYSAVFKTYNGKYGLCGFSMGMQPSFTINGESQTANNHIKITLVDAHTDGLTLDFYDSVDYEYLSSTTWVYTADFNGYECIGEGVARYLLMKEIDAFENETGNYKALEGYESMFPELNIVGTFTTSATFSNIECRSNECTINTSFPSSLLFNSEECQTYYVNADSNWSITSSKSHITVTPSTGVAHTAYAVYVCNTKTPTSTAETSTLTINYCNTSSTVNITVVEDQNACLPQGAVYNVPANGQTLTIPTRCCVESVRETAGFGTSSTVFSNYIQTVIPENTTGNNRQAVLLVVYCDGNSGNIIINQSNIYEEWRDEGTPFCENRNKYQRKYKYTGTTSSNYVKTTVYKDVLIETNSYECYGTDDWRYKKYVLVEGEWFCDDGNKYGLLRLYVSMDNTNWFETDIYKKDVLIEEYSEDCCWDDKWFDYPYTKYEWEGDWICNDGNKYKYLHRYFSMDGVVWEASCIYKMDDSQDGLLELNSEDCGYVNPLGYKIRWVITDQTICLPSENEDPQTIYRWNEEERYMCSGYSKYEVTVESFEFSTDSGLTWNKFYPDITRDISEPVMVEELSADCGYEPERYLTFVAKEDGTFHFAGSKVSYSLDSGNTWSTADNVVTTPTVSSGNTVMWKGAGSGRFSSTGQFDVEGSVMSLMYGDNFSGQTDMSGYSLTKLFSGCTNLISAENLSLPATALTQECYQLMFGGCTSLTTAPSVLPATNLSGSTYCYEYMFSGCTSLTTAPSLPATTLDRGCYHGMFEGCTSLATAPSLPATTLAGSCYDRMFYGCTSLTAAPVLPATTLNTQCYSNMFNGCTLLSSIICLATNISAYICTDNWVANVANSGMFTKASNMSSWTSGDSGIPTNWTVQNNT